MEAVVIMVVVALVVMVVSYCIVVAPTKQPLGRTPYQYIYTDLYNFPIRGLSP